MFGVGSLEVKVQDFCFKEESNENIISFICQYDSFIIKNKPNDQQQISNFNTLSIDSTYLFRNKGTELAKLARSKWRWNQY